jgi:peptidoglycan/LPS O-acetylase OafA/YrhL
LGAGTLATPAHGALRNARIDLLRGVSILLVILDHVAQRIPPGRGVLGTFLPARVIDGFFTHGYEAVFIFFVISGFLITSMSFDRWRRLNQIDLKAFYALRFTRIVPCLLVLIAVLSMLDLLGVRTYVMEHANQSLPGTLTAAVGLYLNWYEGYLSSFLVVLALSLPWTRAAALAINEVWHAKAYLPGMAAIATGVLTALLAAKFQPKRWASVLIVDGSLGIGLIVPAG